MADRISDGYILNHHVLLLAGTYKFYVTPSPRVSSKPLVSLPTTYGAVGDYTLTIEYPAGQTPPPNPPPSPSPSPSCKAATNCNPGSPSSLCGGCSCGFTAAGAATCNCAAAEGFRRGVLQVSAPFGELSVASARQQLYSMKLQSNTALHSNG
jgi:hypothetical protein